MNRSGLITTKLGNTSYFNENGTSFNVTVLKVDDCIVSSGKTFEKNGYNAVQLSSIDTNKDLKKINKAQRKIFSENKISPKKVFKEFRVDQKNILEIGTNLKANHFKIDQYVDASSISIGKGFAGVMKRWNFGGLRASHGVSVSHRSHGSTGQRQDPGKVFKGKKMAGHMGDKLRTILNLEVIKSDLENNLLYLKGSIPGAKNSTVFLRESVKNVTRKTIKEKHEAKIKAAAAKKGKK